MNAYDVDRAWPDRFLPHINKEVGKHLLEISSKPLDWHRATILVVLNT